jgi:hypothetical protein
MPIDATTTVTTQELCALLGCTKGHISHLERDGAITRSARDTWPLIKTVRAVIKAQRHPASAARIRWEQARAA